MTRYIPPRQSKLGQIADVLVILVLTIGALYVPLWLGLAGAAKTPKPIENPTWEALGQNPTMVERWKALDLAEPSAAADIITARFDYSFDWWALIAMAVLVIGYFVMLVVLSDKEYRDIISEKFGRR